MLSHLARAAIRNSDRKASRLLGVTISRNTALPQTKSDANDDPECDGDVPISEVQLRHFFQENMEFDPFHDDESERDADDTYGDSAHDDEDDEEDGGIEHDPGADDEDDGRDDAFEDWPIAITLPRLLHARPLGDATHTPDSESEVADENELASRDKSDARRSRFKVLSVLGPEAAAVL